LKDLRNLVKQSHKTNSGVSVIVRTKGKPPRLPFLLIKEKVLGKSYELSIAFVGLAQSKKLNNQFRKKNYSTDVLSFSLSKNSGELIICEKIAMKKSKEFLMKYPKYLTFILIHGMLHLKGYAHGSKMEKEEKKFLSRF